MARGIYLLQLMGKAELCGPPWAEYETWCIGAVCRVAGYPWQGCVPQSSPGDSP